jgi:hypothetical protein
VRRPATGWKAPPPAPLHMNAATRWRRRAVAAGSVQECAPLWGALHAGRRRRHGAPFGSVRHSAAGGSIYNKMYTQPNGGGKQTIRSDFLVSYLHVSSLFYFTYTPYSIIVPIYVGAGYAAANPLARANLSRRCACIEGGSSYT